MLAGVNPRAAAFIIEAAPVVVCMPRLCRFLHEGNDSASDQSAPASSFTRFDRDLLFVKSVCACTSLQERSVSQAHCRGRLKRGRLSKWTVHKYQSIASSEMQNTDIGAVGVKRGWIQPCMSLQVCPAAADTSACCARLKRTLASAILRPLSTFSPCVGFILPIHVDLLPIRQHSTNVERPERLVRHPRSN